MNKILHFSLFLICLTTFAQPVINSSDFDNLNISYTIKNATSSTFTEGASGANVIWDFSSLILTVDPQVGVETVTQVPNGPFSNSFPNANYVFKGSSNGSEDFFSYFNKTANIIEELGGSNTSAVDFSYIDPYTLLVFPFTYGTISTDSAQEVGQSSPISETLTYDAYGTIITPFGTFNNVVRAKKTQNNSNQPDYTWYKTAPFAPILEVSQSFSGDRNFTFYEPSALTTPSFDVKNIYVFTSLSNEILNIITDDSMQISQTNIIDLTGKKILKQASNSNSINIESLSSGIYFVQVNTNKGLFSQKFIKK